MQLCCYNGDCFNNFKDLPEHIENLAVKPLLAFIHELSSGMLINKVPKGTKWNIICLTLGLQVTMWLRWWFHYNTRFESLWQWQDFC